MNVKLKRWMSFLVSLVFMFSIFFNANLFASNNLQGDINLQNNGNVQQTVNDSVNDSVYNSVYTSVYFSQNKVPKKRMMLRAAEVTSQANDKDVLLIQSVLPWSSDANQEMLNKLGLNYQTVGIDDVPSFDLTKYRLIIVANDQTTDFYNKLSNLRTSLEHYVMNGGTLIYGACDSGWSDGTTNILIPGDVKLNPVDYEYHNYIKDPEHPIVTGELSDGNPLQNSDLYSYYASHRSFNVDSLSGYNDKDIILDNGKDPTLVEYSIGEGTVIASALTWEHDIKYHTGNDGYGTFGGKAFDDLILYAYESSNDVSNGDVSQNLGDKDSEKGTSVDVDDPINAANGNYKSSNHDISIDGNNPITFSRFYNSRDNWKGSLGLNWHNNYEVKLKKLTGRRNIITFEDGHTEDFILGDDGVWFTVAGKYSKIEKRDDGTFFIQKNDGTKYLFDADGNLSYTEALNGRRTNLTYDQGKLTRVCNECGYLTFDYDGSLIKKITDSAGRTVEYEYTNGNLTSFKDAEGNA